jgi:hypothetical protein
MLTAAIALGTASVGVPASAQQAGLVNVDISNIRIELEEIISRNNINVQVPVAANVQVPIAIAAALCDTNVNVLARQQKDGTTTCTPTAESTSESELTALARSIQRQ